MELHSSAVASVKLPATNPAQCPDVAQNNHPEHPPSSQQAPPNGNSKDSHSALDSPPKPYVKIAHPSIALYIAPHLRDPALKALRPPQRYCTSRPYRPIPARSEAKQTQVSSEVQPTFFKSHLVTPPPNPSQLRKEFIQTPVQSQPPQPPVESKANIDLPGK
ncbi:hypothetical protein P170DRAFT_476796 [Aspergillus steynii IBT 23096]|uniref:Uncharacterized protein n=1 Tax=Aspergillus steynii IBT 23096 TaxID=1392250 RepID=A0A2I2G5J7_9EURO|nr:uncharacterized protein P170DRAFT_476796 [Aspergillus steynii IBT 23096]PLB48155.1 hypothetical protein P170DRAFT_476796 [Aspergillus steynii IBT 23096]